MDIQNILVKMIVKQTCLKNNILISIIRLPGVIGKNMPLFFLEDYMNQF